jgi:hypothetical protein
MNHGFAASPQFDPSNSETWVSTTLGGSVLGHQMLGIAV